MADPVKTFLKYANLPLPRHTSYPSAAFWSDFTGEQADEFKQSFVSSALDTSLYFHVPYCRKLCLYCGCNKIIVTDEQRQKNDPSFAYLNHLFAEIDTYAPYFENKQVRQIHFGGGSPTFLRPTQFADLFAKVHSHFSIASDAEIAVEIDPRTFSKELLQVFVDHGVNRISLGVQDFDLAIQENVDRIQPYELVKDTVDMIRESGIDAINFDLIYGMPGQDQQKLIYTIDKVLELRPSRVSYFKLAVLPQLFKWQKTFSRHDLPVGEAVYDMASYMIERFSQAGYEFIGLDHFALASDPLAKAYRSEMMVRNFQGMSTHGELDSMGFGPSAISSNQSGFAQLVRDPVEWLSNNHQFCKGYLFEPRDYLIKDLIHELYCYCRVDLPKLAAKHNLDWQERFAEEAQSLNELELDGIVVADGEGRWQLTPVVGRILLRVVGSVFDQFVPKGSWKEASGDMYASTSG